MFWFIQSIFKKSSLILYIFSTFHNKLIPPFVFKRTSLHPTANGFCFCPGRWWVFVGFASFSLTSSSFSPLERRPVCCVATRPQHGKKISATNLSYSGYFLNRAKLQLRSRGCFINLDSNSTSLGKRRDFIRSLRSTKSWRTKRQQGNNCFQENLEPGIKFR